MKLEKHKLYPTIRQITRKNSCVKLHNFLTVQRQLKLHFYSSEGGERTNNKETKNSLLHLKLKRRLRVNI